MLIKPSEGSPKRATSIGLRESEHAALERLSTRLRISKAEVIGRLVLSADARLSALPASTPFPDLDKVLGEPSGG